VEAILSLILLAFISKYIVFYKTVTFLLYFEAYQCIFL